MFQGHFSTRRFPELQNLPYLTYFSCNFIFSITCSHFGKTLISAWFLSSLINEIRLNYETLFIFSQAAANIFKYFAYTLIKKTQINNFYFKMFCIILSKHNNNGPLEARFVLWRQQLQWKIIKFCLVFDYLWRLIENRKRLIVFKLKINFSPWDFYGEVLSYYLF